MTTQAQLAHGLGTRQVQEKAPFHSLHLCNQCCCVLRSIIGRCLMLGKDAWCCPVSRGVPSTGTHWKCSAPGTKKLYSYGRDFYCAKGTCPAQGPPLYGCFSHEPHAGPRQGLNAVEGITGSLCTEIHSAQTVSFLSYFWWLPGETQMKTMAGKVCMSPADTLSFHLQTSREGKKLSEFLMCLIAQQQQQQVNWQCVHHPHRLVPRLTICLLRHSRLPWTRHMAAWALHKGCACCSRGVIKNNSKCSAFLALPETRTGLLWCHSIL